MGRHKRQGRKMPDAQGLGQSRGGASRSTPQATRSVYRCASLQTQVQRSWAIADKGYDANHLIGKIVQRPTS
jgi:hypothetical protein